MRDRSTHSGLAAAATTATAPAHRRTRSRMDEVVQAAAAAAAVAAAASSNTSNLSPQRGKKRKNRHSSVHEPASNEDPDSMIPPEQRSDDDLLNQIIASLSLPSRDIAVANSHSNQRYSSPEQAFAKLAGQNWTYYLNETEIVIGRGEKDAKVNVDLGPGKMVSRKHASISYENEEWWLTVDGRNGLKVDGVSISMHEKIALSNGTILEIGGVQMMFVLPAPFPRETLLVIHARQYNLPIPFETSSPIKRSDVGRRSSSPSLTYPQGVRIVQGPRIIASPNGTHYSQHGEIDLSLEANREIKPQYSYAMMIAQAILSVPERKMQLSKIYEFIMSRYAYYRYAKSGWQNSIRHNLSLNKAFVKVPRRTDEPGKGMKWQISEEYLEEFIAKVNRTMTPRGNKKSYPTQSSPMHRTLSGESSPLRTRYPPSASETPIRSLQISPSGDVTTTPTALHFSEQFTPERQGGQRQFVPMSSPAPFYRYSNISTPATAPHHERSSPPSSGAIDLAETLVEFSSPVKIRESLVRRRSVSEDRQDEGSPQPLGNGVKSSSLGDLQGVDLLRGFEKISSSWREGGSPIKEVQSVVENAHHGGNENENENGSTIEERRGEENGTSVNGAVMECSVQQSLASSTEGRDSQMTDVKMEA